MITAEPKVEFPRYESYRDSGVDWYEKVPTDWSVLPGLACVKENKTKNNGLKEKTVLSLSYGKIVIKPEEKLTGLVPESFETYQIVEPGDIIIRGTDLQNDKTSLRVGYVQNHGIITSAYLCLKIGKKQLSKFTYYLLHTLDTCKALYGLGSGLRQNLSFLDFKRLPFLVPTLDEQQRIANFLDEKTAEIDEAIVKKQRLIALLKEQKAILINQSVTKGLNPNAPLKDSHIPWIGQIPEHWEVRRLKNVCYRIVDCLHATPNYREDGEYPAIRTADIEPGVVLLSKAKRISESDFAKWTERLEPKTGDILYSREGERFGIAASVPPDTKLCISQRMMVFRPKEAVDHSFITWLLNSSTVYRQALVDVFGATSPHINISTIRNYRLPIPPKAEQKKISNMLNQVHDEVASLSQHTVTEIEALREFKQTLIAHAVTGKLKVD